MSPLAQLQAFTQKVYLVIKGRYFDDITGADGITLIQQTVDWVNMFVDELETEVNPDGQPLDWRWLWQENYALGTATQGAASVPLPTGVNELLTNEGRYVQITQDGTVVSNWAVVSPEQITNKTNRTTEDTCARIGSSIVFSRAFKDYENNGAITGDVSTSFPRIAINIAADGSLNVTNLKLLTTVRPQTLLVLGTAKNASLPDIVQGGLSPSYSQKYTDLFNNAVARNGASSQSSEIQREDLSNVTGVY